MQNEPIRRGAGKPNMCRYLIRTAEQVYVSGKYPNGLTTKQYHIVGTMRIDD